MSGLGKGVTASSIGLILKACGLRVTSIKIGPSLLSLLIVSLSLSLTHTHTTTVSSSTHLCNARRNTKEKQPTNRDDNIIWFYPICTIFLGPLWPFQRKEKKKKKKKGHGLSFLSQLKRLKPIPHSVAPPSSSSFKLFTLV